jgi:hypothetical protein
MFRSMLVIDDFFANPMEVRAAALALSYPKPDKPQPYPGVTSAQPMLWPNSDQMFSQIIGEPLRAKSGFFHGHYRKAYEGNRGFGYIHIDPDTVWAGVLYMTLPEHCQGGTEFFRHKKYGTDGAPINAEQLKIYGEDNADKLVDRLTEVDGLDPANWDHITTLPMRFNRLILFRGWMWHTAGVSFGTSDENCRLVQVFFFESAQQPRQKR